MSSLLNKHHKSAMKTVDDGPSTSNSDQKNNDNKQVNNKRNHQRANAKINKRKI